VALWIHGDLSGALRDLFWWMAGWLEMAGDSYRWLDRGPECMGQPGLIIAAATAASILLSDQRTGPMHTLVLRQVPDGLYRRLKAVAAAHRRSMNQQAILALEAGLTGHPAPSRRSAEESRRWLQEQVWPLALLDERSTEEILGYGDDGLCG
jgi:plasmid stability protein